MLVGFIIAILLVVVSCILELKRIEKEDDNNDRKH